MTPRIARISFAALAAFLAAFAAATAQEQSYVLSRDTPQWFKQSFFDFPEDVAEAAEDGKRLMIYFGQDGCPYCRRLHDVNFRQTEILALLRENFDSIAVNIFGDVPVTWVNGEEHTEKSLATALGAQFTPTLLFLDENGGEALRLSGYQPPAKFIAALRYVIDKREGEPFADYLRAALPKRPNAGDRPALSAPPYALSSPNAPTAVFITQRDCPACDEWREFLAGEKAQQWRRHFNFVELDMFGREPTIDGDITEEEWTRRRQVAFTPALVFLGEDGRETFRVDGYLRSFHLASVLDYIASGAHRDEPEFQRFLQARADRLREEGEDVKIW